MEQLTLLQTATPAQQEAMAMHFEIVEAAKAAASSLLELGRRLKRMRDSGRYKELGFESFGAYTEAAVGLRQRQAYNYITVVESLPAQLIEENAAAGITKLALLAKLGPQDREELAGGGQLANITVTELQQLIEEKNGMAQQLSMLENMRSMEQAVPAEVEEIDMDSLREEIAGDIEEDIRAALRAEFEKELQAAVKEAKKDTAAQVDKARTEAKQAAEKAAADRLKAAKDAAAKELDKARQEAAQQAQKEQAARDAAELETARAAQAAAVAKAEETAKQLQLAADEDGIKFMLLFNQLQEKVQAMRELAARMQAAGRQEHAQRYTGALNRALAALAEG